MINYLYKKAVALKIYLFILMGESFPHWTRRINVGGNVLIVPLNHMLDVYKSKNSFYDHFLPVLCHELSKVSNGGKIVDIGANVGDTIALIREAGVDSEIIAIEASSFFFSLLQKNISAVPGGYGRTKIMHAFVGDPSKTLILTYTTGTAGASESYEKNSTTEADVIALGQIDDGNIGLIKIDTDGYDGHILLSGLDYIKEKKPILWAETLIPDLEAFDQWSDFIHGIVGSYEGFYLFDNTGRPVSSGLLDQRSAHLLLDLLLTSFMQKSLETAGVGNSATPYYDLVLFPTIESSVWKSFSDRVALAINEKCQLNILNRKGRKGGL